MVMMMTSGLLRMMVMLGMVLMVLGVVVVLVLVFGLRVLCRHRLCRLFHHHALF
jgi:hypothetical protein